MLVLLLFLDLYESTHPFPFSQIEEFIFLDHILYRLDDLSIVKGELSKDVSLPQERVHGFLVYGVWNLSDFLSFFWIYLDPNFSNNVSKQVTLRHDEDSLPVIQGYPIFLASLKKIIEVA